MSDILSSLNLTNMIASTSEWIAPLFDELLPWALAGLGLVLAGTFVSWLIKVIYNSLGHLFMSKTDGLNEPYEGYLQTYDEKMREKHNLKY